MPGTTPLYQLPYVLPSDGIKTLPTTDRERAELIEAVLKQKGQRPLASELVALIERMNELEEAQTSRTEIYASAGASTPSGTSAAPPAGAEIIRKIQRVVTFTDEFGVIKFDFPVPFPNACAAITFTLLDESSSAPGLDARIDTSKPLSKGGFSVGWPGRGARLTAFTYIAEGW